MFSRHGTSGVIELRGACPLWTTTASAPRRRGAGRRDVERGRGQVRLIVVIVVVEREDNGASRSNTGDGKCGGSRDEDSGTGGGSGSCADGSGAGGGNESTCCGEGSVSCGNGGSRSLSEGPRTGSSARVGDAPLAPSHIQQSRTQILGLQTAERINFRLQNFTEHPTEPNLEQEHAQASSSVVWSLQWECP